LIGVAVVWYLMGGNQPPVAACPYNGNTDEATFQNIIRAEEIAALNEDITIADQIYLPGATVTDVPTGVTSPVLQHYQDFFATLDFIELQHYNIEIVQINSSNAWVTSSDSGILFFKETGERLEYVSEPGASHYIFGRDTSGCWKISHFSKQAENELFP